jgi:glycosyltransferase involved in cell wall biosynthesis
MDAPAAVRRMNVLLVVHQFFPEFSAGTEVLTLGVARGLRARGHHVRILSGHPALAGLQDAQRRTTYQYDGFQVYRFHHAYEPMGEQTSMLEIGADNHLAARYLQDILAEFAADRVHYFHLNRLGTGLIVEAERAGVAQSMTPTDFWTICTTAQLRYADGSACSGPTAGAGNCVLHLAQDRVRSPRWNNLLRRVPAKLADTAVRACVSARVQTPTLLREVRAMGERLPKTIARLNRLDHIVAPNRFMRDKLSAYGVEPQRIVELPYGVELPRAGSPASAAAETARVPGAPLRIGFIGTLAPHKGAHVLVDAFAQLSAGLAQLSLYGATHDFPEYAGQLQTAAQAAGARMAGTFAAEDIFQVLSTFDLLVVPSLWYENTPLVVFSAQAAGLPVIASDFPGLAAAVRHETDGLLFPPGDTSALATVLQQLAEQPERLVHLSAAVRPPKSIETYVDELLELWRA